MSAVAPLVLASLLALAGVAEAQDPAFWARLDPATAEIVRPILTAAADDDLPVGALESKVLEGVAKRVPPARIGQVVADLAVELGTVRGQLRERLPGVRLSDGEIVAAARAVGEGVPVEALEALWSARPHAAALDVPVTVLGELVRRGIPVAQASEVMSHVVRTEVPVSRAAQIPGRFDSALGRAPTAVAALQEALRALEIPNPSGRRPGR